MTNMEGQQWIIIPNWDATDIEEGLQHYKDRDPIWIKNYRRLLNKEEYLNLSFHCRGILHGLWLEYAASNRQISGSTVALTRRLGQRVTRRNLEALNHAGFIEISASRPLATCYPRLRSREEKKELTHNRKTSKTNPAMIALQTMIRNGALTDEVDLEAEARAHNLNDLEHQQLINELKKAHAA